MDFTSVLAKKSITFDPKNQCVCCFAHVINLAAKKLIDNLQVPLLYEDESSFEEAEDTEDNLKDTIYKPLHNTVSADKNLKKYILLEEEWEHIIEILQDKYDKKKESDKKEDEKEDDDDNESENNKILCILKQSIEKIKKYYTFTSGLIYTAATILDPRIKLQYYKDNMWEKSFIQETRKQVTNLWKTTYKLNISENVELELHLLIR
ncbi:hypothetical protein RhiirA4_481756 [Rhizophagus irregularis]|uniref:Uncharacterized protein n=1 Tax=Rhizophagus irregularis TaxID=588596 RepID=A0A2I1HK01_9GLOM|nr:hypothetical protein RhiirA4_481756 [Rhizophagus irregularis]